MGRKVRVGLRRKPGRSVPRPGAAEFGSTVCRAGHAARRPVRFTSRFHPSFMSQKSCLLSFAVVCALAAGASSLTAQTVPAAAADGEVVRFDKFTVEGARSDAY